jgi:hypothetical protein
VNREFNAKLKEYYKSKHWRKFVKDILEPMDTECEICHGKRWKTNRKKEKKINRAFCIHHKHYRSLFNEKREDVNLMCRRCHNLAHDILKIASTAEAILALKEVIRKYFTYEDKPEDIKYLDELTIKLEEENRNKKSRKT